jgi:hypothetical protein
MKSIR